MKETLDESKNTSGVPLGFAIAILSIFGLLIASAFSKEPCENEQACDYIQIETAGEIRMVLVCD